jgi:hypothetical protein
VESRNRFRKNATQLPNRIGNLRFVVVDRRRVTLAAGKGWAVRSSLVSRLNWPWQMALGTWQGLYLFERRRAPQRREVVLYLIGE